VDRRDPGTSEDYFERIIWPSYRQWNSHPLGIYEQRLPAAGGEASDVQKQQPQLAVEHEEILFVDGEADVDQVFQCAVDHINARREAHVATSPSA
jgi:hypothetical protein